jgi:hypothetical protein
MPEQITLTTAVQAATGATKFRVWALDLRRAHPDRPAGILAIFREVDAAGAFLAGGRMIECRYEDAAADALLIGLNKANLSVKSLEKRVTETCQADGKLGAGAITGAPD